MISKILNHAVVPAIGLAIVLLILSVQIFAQKAKSKTTAKNPTVTKKDIPVSTANLPKVTQIDEVAMLSLLKREGENQKPLLVNFWATWCGPCVEEFPDLVKIDNDYKGKIDFITITLDDLADINTGVPKFLQKMNAGMPTYLLKVADEGETISKIDKDFNGGLPFTLLFDGKGNIAYKREAKVVIPALRSELDKLTLAK